MTKKSRYIWWFNEIHKEDVAVVGGKGANLGEMASIGLPVPKGFVVTVAAYFDFLKENNLKPKIKELFDRYRLSDPRQVEELAGKAKKLIHQGKISPALAKEIIFNYLKIGGLFKPALVAVRSSATAEDSLEASFAGQQVTFLNVRGEANLIKRVRDCWASLFEPRAIFYRQEKDFDHLKAGIAVPVQQMIESEVSGVMFTIDPVTNQKNRLVIEAVWGLGEYMVQGTVSPDHYVISRDKEEILERRIAKQTVQWVKAASDNREIKVPLKKQLKRKLSDRQILELAKIGKKIHQHYYHPQDIEWAWYKNNFYLIQTRPVTTVTRQEVVDEFDTKQKLILTGRPASPGVGSGQARIIKTARQIDKVLAGEVLVTGMTTPDFVPAMKRVVAIVTDKGGQTSHAAIVSRELGIPCVVGTGEATRKLKTGMVITVDGTEGTIYAGKIKREEKKETQAKIAETGRQKTATKVYVNLAEPTLASRIARRHVDGVGLLRAEFMIAEIGEHPKKMLKEGKGRIFTNKLVSGIAEFCRAFAPRPVIYRATDFKTNEYRHLKGGAAYEPQEENPMLGYRGAFRYLADPAVFELELAAIKQIRNKMNLKNLWLMIPFCRTPQEFLEVKRLLAANDLLRTPSFKLFLMVEIPVNVILLEEYLKVGLDGVSIGSNDLTMLVLGVDRDNAQLAGIFNEMNPAVLWAIEKTIKTCLKHKVMCSICGQAPSVYPELVEKLVKWGVTSVSVNPDAIERTREYIYHAENKCG
ncbi:MAG: phosphoenolpyruvate synthase [Candidatus Shapirobacteria bacterium]